MVTLARILERWRRLTGPAPLDEFADYDEYWQRRGAIHRIIRRWIIAADLLPDQGTLLDVGCGSGDFLAYLRRRKPKIRSKGIDVSEKSVRMTRELGFEAEVVNLLERDLGGQFDFITCFEVLEHIPDAEVVLRRMKSAFTKQLLISVPNVGYIGCRTRLAVFGRFPLTTCIMHVKEHVRFWTTRDFREWAAHEGLRVVRVQGTRGLKFTPWRRWPSLLASGVLYALEHAQGRDGASRHKGSDRAAHDP